MQLPALLQLSANSRRYEEMLMLAEMVLAEAGVGEALWPQYTLDRALIEPQ